MPQHTELRFRIAGVSFLLRLPHAVELLERFRPFLCEELPPSFWQIDYFPVDVLPAPDAEPLFSGTEYCDYSAGTALLRRVFHDALRGNEPYAVSLVEPERKRVTVSFRKDRLRFLSDTANTFFLSCWETVLLLEGRMILHASLVDASVGGILFSGVSGIGKSTQADLWCRHDGARLLNGDRPILYRSSGCWQACGSPYAGSSKCYCNDSTAVSALVLLGRAKQNLLRPLSAADAFRALYAGLTFNSVDTHLVERQCALLQQLVSEVPVYALSCLPERSAVELLKVELQKR